jgi:hypothetical protein
MAAAAGGSNGSGGGGRGGANGGGSGATGGGSGSGGRRGTGGGAAAGGGGGSAAGGAGCAISGVTGGTPAPAAPSHARTTVPGFPVGTWIDRTPCRIPYAWPPDIRDARAVFDADRSRVVLVGTWNNQLEVWEVDPTTAVWYDRTPCVLPQSWPPTGGPLGYDRSRHKVVLFDGGTWEWDGQAGTWELRASSFAWPEADPDALMGTTYLEWDPQRRTLVLPGWELFDWDGAAGSWTHRWSSPMDNGPPTLRLASSGASFAYDPDRGVMLTFGGEVGTTITQELWETDGVTWTNRTPAPLPAAWPPPLGWNGRLFYETTTRKMILSGGPSIAGALDDLWAFDATTGTFTAAPPEPSSWSPQPGTFAATAGGGRVMVFQYTSPDRYLGHVVSWDVAAGTITDLRPGHVPVSWPLTAADGTAAAYDVRRGRVVLFGGWGDGTTTGTSANLLEWNGDDGTWQDRTVARNCQTAWPPSRRQHVMAADSRRGRILIFGGEQLLPDDRVTPAGDGPYLGPKLSDLWEWDGQAGTFTKRTPATAGDDWPTSGADIAANSAMTYDEARDRVVLLGGGGGNPWEWDPATGTWTPPPGPGVWNAQNPALRYSLRDATTFLVQAESGGAPEVDSWDPAARAWTSQLAADPFAVGPRWSTAAGAVVDPISGLVWVVSLSPPVWSWQSGATHWTDRSSDAMPPTSGDPVPGGVLVFDEHRGTLVLFGQANARLGVWELAVR